MQKNTRLIAAIDERPATYSSMFLEVGKGSSIIIDILMPKHGNGLLISSKNIKIDYTFEGIGYYFGTKFIEMINGSFPSIKIAFPSIIKKIQRRFAFRVSPSTDNPVNVELISGIAEAISDISEGGLSFYTRFTEEKMRVGMILDRVILKLPAVDRKITTKAIIKNYIKGSGGVRNRCGVEFVDISMSDKNSIAYYVITRQKEIARRLRGEN